VVALVGIHIERPKVRPYILTLLKTP